MSNGIYIALSGAQAELRRLDVVSNNLANANTPGYKKDEMNFQEVLANRDNIPDSQQDRRFVEAAGTHTDMSSGTLRHTGNDQDLAIRGDGFFQVQTPRGVRLTRGGTFLRNQKGQLMTSAGHLLLGKGGVPVQIPGGGRAMNIDAAGRIAVAGKVFSQISVVNVADTGGMAKEEQGLFRINEGNQIVESNGEVHQGFIEESNGNSVDMMIQLVSTQRHYDSLHRAMDTYRDMDSKATRIIG